MPGTGRAPTRRGVLSAAALPLGLPTISSTTEPPGDGRTETAASLCQRWREFDCEARDLVRKWQRIESHLFRYHGWPGLTEAEQLRLPAAEPLFAIDRRLAIVDAQRDMLLPAIRRTNARDFAEVEAKLQVLERIVYREDHPEAHALIRSTRRDIANLRS